MKPPFAIARRESYSHGAVSNGVFQQPASQSETPERGLRALECEGLQVEDLTPGKKRRGVVASAGPASRRGTYRVRVSAPCALLPESMFRGSWCSSEAVRKNLPEPPLKPTALDKALEWPGNESLRWSLSRYLIDSSMLRESGGSSYEPGVRDPAANRLPFNTDQAAAMDRIAFIQRRLSREDKRDLGLITAMWFEDDLGERLSMVRLAKQRTGEEDERVGRGIAIGITMKMAERLLAIYRMRDFPKAHICVMDA